MGSNTREKSTIINKFLNIVEKIGNRLPDPSILFFLMCLGLAIITWVVSLFHVTVKHPGTGNTIGIKSKRYLRKLNITKVQSRIVKVSRQKKH